MVDTAKGFAGLFGVGRLRSPREVSSSWSWLTLQFPEAYALKAHSIMGARSGSSSMVRSSRPISSRLRTFRYPMGARPFVPPPMAFWVMPLVTSVARLRE